MPIDDRIRDGLRLNAEQPVPSVEEHLEAVLHRRRRKVRVRGAVAAGALALLVGVPWAVDRADRPSEPPPVVATPDGSRSALLPPELQGTWMVRATRSEVRADLRRLGLGRYADRFFEAEGLGPGPVRVALTYAADRFEVRWKQPDGTWFVGWFGKARESGGRVVMTDAESKADDTFRWTVAGDRLRLRFVSTTTPDQGGVPFEVYSRGYFTRPLQRVDCAPTDLDPCL